MDPYLTIEQAVVRRGAYKPAELVARSPGVTDRMAELAGALAEAFVPRPAGVRCPGGTFAYPFGPGHAAVVRVIDEPDGPDTPLYFHLLILGRGLYRALGDPFAVADRFPPFGDAVTLEWPADAPPARRTVEQLQAVLKAGDGPFLLGAAQALVDGGRVMAVRDGPDAELLRSLLLLLPDRTRCEKWPATFAYGPGPLRFDVAVTPPGSADAFAGYLTEDQARDYPEGRYEKQLQIAVEDGDQGEVDRLFARPTAGQAFALAAAILVGSVAVLAASRLFGR